MTNRYFKIIELFLTSEWQTIVYIIGILILFGITKKTKISIEELWSNKSIHFCSFALATFSCERFKLILQNVTFDDLSKILNQMNHLKLV